MQQRADLEYMLRCCRHSTTQQEDAAMTAAMLVKDRLFLRRMELSDIGRLPRYSYFVHAFTLRIAEKSDHSLLLI